MISFSTNFCHNLDHSLSSNFEGQLNLSMSPSSPWSANGFGNLDNLPNTDIVQDCTNSSLSSWPYVSSQWNDTTSSDKNQKDRWVSFSSDRSTASTYLDGSVYGVHLGSKVSSGESSLSLMPTTAKSNVTTATTSTVDSALIRAWNQANDHLFFRNGCCIPTIQSYWMLLVMVLSLMFLVGCFCGFVCLAKWIYKRRGRKRRDTYLTKYKDEEAGKRQMEIRTKKLQIGSNRDVHTHNHYNLANQLEQDVKLARISNHMISREWTQPSNLQRGISCENLAPLKSMNTGSHSLPPLPLCVQSPAPVGNPAVVHSSISTTGTLTTGAATTPVDTVGTTATGSKMTLATTGDEPPSRFEMQHETFAAVVGLMAQHCNDDELKKKELRNKPPILHSKNPRRMDSSLEKSKLSSHIDSCMDSDSASATPKESIENLKNKGASPSELSVSIPTVSFDDEDGGKKKSKKSKKKSKGNKKVAKKTAIATPKQPSLTTIEENEEYQPEYSDRGIWKTGATFPYYKDSSAKKKGQDVNQNISPSVRKADNCMSTSATTRMKENDSDRTAPSSDSTVSRIPNVYQLRQEVDSQRRQLAQPEQDLVEEKQKRMKNRISSSNGVIGPGEGYLEKNRNAYETKQGNRNSPYDIGFFMDESKSDRA